MTVTPDLQFYIEHAQVSGSRCSMQGWASGRRARTAPKQPHLESHIHTHNYASDYKIEHEYSYTPVRKSRCSM